jgi:transcriptional regulator with XRE-family HTH domain
MQYENIVTEERLAERLRMEEAGDTEGVLRWDLGVYITSMRLAADLDQEQAAKRAGMSREHWSRLENGHAKPKRESISAIADAIHVDVGGLYRRAGYAVPDELKIYDMKRAKRALEVSLLESTSLAEFLIDMQLVWQEFQLQRVGRTQRWSVDPAYAQIVEHLFDSFSLKQRVALAQAIIQRSPKGQVPNSVGDHRFFDQLDSWVEELVTGLRAEEVAALKAK